MKRAAIAALAIAGLAWAINKAAGIYICRIVDDALADFDDDDLDDDAAQRIADYQAHTRSAFQQAMDGDGPVARMAARIAANEAARVDDEWAALNEESA